MSKDNLIKSMSIVLADTYTLYLKTQNYHWHVKGSSFKSLHGLFEEQYTELANAVDAIAERILTLGSMAPATFTEFLQLTTLKEGDSALRADAMLKDLVIDQDNILLTLKAALHAAQEMDDEGSVALLGERIGYHEKTRWMLQSSL